MTKNHFFKIVLLGVTLYLVANELSILVVSFMGFFLRILPLPNVLKLALPVVLQIGSLAVFAFLASKLYGSKYDDEKWVSSFTRAQLFVFIGAAVINAAGGIYILLTSLYNSGVTFNFLMLKGLLLNLAIFLVLMILSSNLKDISNVKTSTQVRYSTPNDVQKSSEKLSPKASIESSASESSATSTSRTIPPDLPN